MAPPRRLDRYRRMIQAKITAGARAEEAPRQQARAAADFHDGAAGKERRREFDAEPLAQARGPCAPSRKPFDRS